VEVLVPNLFAFALSALLALAPDGAPRVPRLLTGAEVQHLLTSPERHVRALDPLLAEVLAVGVHRSPTLGFLLAALERTDVIVHIVSATSMPLSTPARLMLVPDARTYRFLRMEVRAEGTDDDLVATLGHELRHALEIAEAPEVRDARSLMNLYRRIGHQDGGDGQFDSEAAHDTARQIRRELYTAAAQARATYR
jgi:hypothetical protein